MVWRQDDTTADSIYAATYDGSAWSAAPTLLETLDTVASNPQVALNDEGRAVAVWQQNDGTADSIYASLFH